MFGFLAPQSRIPEWRQSYARICQHQRRLFGLTSLPFLSYEATFLYQVAIDLKLIPELAETSPQCCRLRRLPADSSAVADLPAQYAAAVGLLLAGVKLADDVQDSGHLIGRLLYWKYRFQVRSARKLIASNAPSIIKAVETAIQQHGELESSGRAMDIADYSVATGDGFAAVFSGMASTAGSPNDHSVREQLRVIGDCVGRAIIAWDCAVDFDKDRIKGEYNPLRSQSEVQRAFDYCLLQLAELGWQLPQHSTSRIVAAGVAERVRRRSRQPVSQHPVRRLERWGLIREQGFAYARCDGCDVLCAVGDCCECIGGAGELAGGCAQCGVPGNSCDSCCGDCCCWHATDSSCGDKSKRRHSAAKNDSVSNSAGDGPYNHYVGSRGLTKNSLNPSGQVTIDESTVSARSASGAFIAAGLPVCVVRADEFGVYVTSAD